MYKKLVNELNKFDDVTVHIYSPNGEDEDSYLSYCNLFVYKCTDHMGTYFRLIIVPDAYMVDFKTKYSIPLSSGDMFRIYS